jgi:lysophospholipase L1-like esterase
MVFSRTTSLALPANRRKAFYALTSYHILLLMSLLLLVACDRTDPVSSTSSRPMGRPGLALPVAPKEGAIRYLALGDSYTIGQSVDVPARYPVQIAARLRDQKLDVGDPIIIARTGWTTRDLLDAIDTRKPQGPFNLVTLLIGVNNQYQGRSIDEYRKQLAQLLKISIALADDNPRHVVVLSTPDWGVTPYAGRNNRAAIAGQIDAFNIVEAEECAKLGVVVVPITDISRTALDHADLMAGDGLHPSAKMYALWTDAAMPAITKALEPTASTSTAPDSSTTKP